MGSIVFKSGLGSIESAKDLSIVVITLNEEINLRSLLPDFPKGAEVIIVDSKSSDQTVSIAESYGALVNIRQFDNYSSQKNFAIGLASRPWTLCLDADERPDAALWSDILGVISKEQSHNIAYDVSRRLVFLGRKMKFGRTKDHVLRLFRSHSATFRNEIHEQLILAQGVSRVKLKGNLWHYSYHDLDDYFSRFNRYTTQMAQSRLRASVSPPSALILAIRLPIDFVARYILRLGFIDGWPGFLWALFGSFYGFVKYAKLKEALRVEKTA